MPSSRGSHHAINHSKILSLIHLPLKLKVLQKSIPVLPYIFLEINSIRSAKWVGGISHGPDFVILDSIHMLDPIGYELLLLNFIVYVFYFYFYFIFLICLVKILF